MERARAVADRRWLIGTLVLMLVVASPLLLVDVPPVLDYPNHLARMFVLAHPDDPVLSQIYAPHWRILPNLGIDIIGTGLLKITPVHVGGRLLLALSLLVPMVGVALYHRAAFGRIGPWPLAASLAAGGAVFQLGFMNFLLALGLALAGAAGWMTLRRRVALPWAVLAGAVVAAATFLSHIFGAAFFLLLIGAEEAARLVRLWRSGRSVLRAALRIAIALAVVLLPVLLLYLASPLAETPALPGQWRGWDKLLAITSPFMATNFDVTILTTLGVAIFLVLTWRRMAVAPALLLAMSVLVAAFVLAPSTLKGGTFVDIRIMLMIVLLGFAGLSPDLPRRQTVMALLALATLVGIRTVYTASTWRDHRSDLADIRAAIAGVAPGAKVLVARGHRGNETQVSVPARALPGVYRLDGHLGALLAIERKAFWPLMFADPAQQPVEVRPPFKALAQSPGEPVEIAQLTGEDSATPKYMADWRHHFTQVLLIDPPSPLPAIPGLLPLYVGSYAVLYQVVPSL